MRSCVAFPATGHFENRLPLGQIVPHHDVDPDLLLFAQDRLAAGERKQHAYGGARLMSKILQNRGIHNALQQQPARQRRDVVPDEHHLLVAAGVAQRFGDALRAGADVIKADNVRMPA